MMSNATNHSECVCYFSVLRGEKHFHLKKKIFAVRGGEQIIIAGYWCAGLGV
jgi:mannose-6-phosphate isomerase-like protein (cupin superfamily)